MDSGPGRHRIIYGKHLAWVIFLVSGEKKYKACRMGERGMAECQQLERAVVVVQLCVIEIICVTKHLCCTCGLAMYQ